MLLDVVGDLMLSSDHSFGFHAYIWSLLPIFLKDLQSRGKAK